MQFRKDINGLRAVAVLSVVLFHFNANIMPGGFSGVDVFFVISGFLMTAIISKGLINQDFSLLNFYYSRAKRILPALSVACLFSVIYAFFFLYDTEFLDTIKQSATALTFLSNLYFWKTSSYFASGSESKILLHTWSLAVEWQFYILYPLILIICTKIINFNKIFWVILLGFILSFCISVYASPKWATSSYYLLPTRVWQMLLGGIACFTLLNKHNKHSGVISYIGLALIILSSFLFSGDDIWPGYLALLPCIGAFLILISHKGSFLLNSKPAQLIGKSSYSIYLWHWIVFYLLNRYSDMSGFAIASGVIVSLLLGHASYLFIEKNSFSRTNIMLISFSFLITLFFYFSFNSLKDYRYISNTEENKLVMSYANSNHNDVPWGYNLCETGNKNSCAQGGVFLWGDSHARALYHGLKHSPVKGFSMYTGRSCPPSVVYPNYQHSVRVACNKYNKEALKQIKLKKPDTVILARRHHHETSDWDKIAIKLKDLGVQKVILIGPVPQFKDPLPLLVAKKYMDQDYIKVNDIDQNIFKSNNAVRALKSENYVYVDILAKLCPFMKCVFRTTQQKDNTKLMNFDAGHLTKDGSTYIVNNFLLEKL